MYLTVHLSENVFYQTNKRQTVSSRFNVFVRDLSV